MTTENETVVDEPEVVDNEPKTPRSISVLLNLGTYQGMTDEEIDMVFNYKLNLELASAKSKLLYNDLTEANKQRIEDSQRALQLAEEQLELVKNKQFVLKKVNVNG